MGRRHIRPGTRLQFTLSPAERDLILERTFIDPEIGQQLREAQVSDSRLVIGLTLDDLEDVAGYIAAEANHCEDRRVQRSLYAVYDRLSKLQHEYTDEAPPRPAVVKTDHVSPLKYTAKQGQYLAFIYYYNKIHGIPPAEADLQRYFRVSPPVVHQTIVALEQRGLIERQPGKARSIRLLIARSELPDLE
jgi:DNA-binding MarR family transcriptional regulator